jgi:hypothetical protein
MTASDRGACRALKTFRSPESGFLSGSSETLHGSRTPTGCTRVAEPKFGDWLANHGVTRAGTSRLVFYLGFHLVR